jgi:hypothetical protein
MYAITLHYANRLVTLCLLLLALAVPMSSCKSVMYNTASSVSRFAIDKGS